MVYLRFLYHFRNANCEWEIKASTRYDVNILVLFLDIEYDELCTFDNLSFYEGKLGQYSYFYRLFNSFIYFSSS